MAASIADRVIAPLIGPISLLRRKLRQPFDKFLNSRSGPFPDSVKLDSRRVYILPTRVGMIFTLLLIVLLLGSINYTKSLGFMLTFLLAGLGNVAMLMTWRNLAGLRLKGMGAKPVFAGQNARFTVQIENETADKRYSISIQNQSDISESADIAANNLGLLHFESNTDKRGRYNPGRIRIETEFPLGLFVAWTWVDLDMSALVYPAPAQGEHHVVSIDSRAGEEQADGEGLEDFAGLRKYQAGDSWRRVSWKTWARSDELFSKEFTGGQPELQWIDWFTLEEADIERRLSVLTRMILDAQSSGRLYGLRIPGQEISPDSGTAHQHECLKVLALYRLTEDEHVD